jgi:hypothetical protein
VPRAKEYAHVVYSLLDATDQTGIAGNNGNFIIWVLDSAIGGKVIGNWNPLVFWRGWLVSALQY